MMGMRDQIERAIDMGGGQTCDIEGVIQELEKAGFVIVPREPTEAMEDAGTRIEFICRGIRINTPTKWMRAQWRAMIGAVPR
jgi:hypothetical protein